MTIDRQFGHAPLSSSPSQPAAIKTPSNTTGIMDESTRNKFLKQYKTAVASGVSTIFATLAVVSAPGAIGRYGVKRAFMY